LTRRYGVFCILGERTRELAGDEFTFREIDRVQDLTVVQYDGDYID